MNEGKCRAGSRWVTATCTVIRPCKGTEGPDTIVSTDDRTDEILTLGGDDVVVLLGDGEDRVLQAVGPHRQRLDAQNCRTLGCIIPT